MERVILVQNSPRLATIPEVKEIIIYDNLSRHNYNLFLGNKIDPSGKIRFIPGDLLDSRKLRQVLQGTDMVYHLAAKVSTPFDNTDAHFHEQVNHWGTSELVLAVEELGIERFVYTSSTSVYGSCEDLVNEDSIANPVTFYGISKLRGEDHVKRLFNKARTYIIRCGNVYGYSKSMRFDAVINRFMFDANFNRRISIHGNGHQSRAFIHIDILSRLLSRLIYTELPSGIFNAVDRNLSVLDIVDDLKKIFPDLEFIFINQHLSLRELKVNPASKLREAIDFDNPKVLFDELSEFKDRFSF